MREKAVSRPWSQQEDDLLRIAVAKHGLQDNWKAVAGDVPGRNNKACRKRWLHSLSPAIKKSAWTMAEDALLLHLYNVYGPKWSHIARYIEGRTDDACSKRYNDALDPTLKRDEWTIEEDDRLMQAYAEIGGKWREIGLKLQRSSLACRNRFKVVERKQRPVQDSSSSSHTQNSFEEFPYYPPESYPLFSPEDGPATFREPTPEAPPLVPTPPPFQYSSSSLSAALEEPPSTLRFSPYFDQVPMDITYDPTPGSSSTSSPYAFAQDFNHNSMLLDDLSDPNPFIPDRNSLPTFYSHHNDFGLVPDDNGVCPAGPSRIEQYQPNADTTDKLLTLEEFSSIMPNQQLAFLNESPMNLESPDLSSGPSSPFTQTTGSSLTSSPIVPSPAELASDTSLPSQSLLFSSSTAGPKDLVNARKTQGPARLSSILPLSDGSLRPYACGHAKCWPDAASTSAACFSTARELFEHVKLHTESEDQKPYRCALPGCNKFWKSLNGLQYHLQLSSAHFQQAMSKTFSTQKNASQTDSTEPTDVEVPDNNNSKRWVCDQPDCFKSYKNSSGLRYHKKHGHPKTIPMQLDNVPPALARDLPARTRKMRKKDDSPVNVAVAAAA
ncbi:hypothetical protein BDP27DRAFT_1319881 [Rhodocollybia butyracea]|uniref:Uncharacterized protein n=1 Tax=Rhodocollybia butyracea TaxID=206335 RepID=A0A9P5Q0D4_9AGAR|nr:hypothetical protein BDP27DRAFT_1319881 [Rhodocollybia butyracea]